MQKVASHHPMYLDVRNLVKVFGADRAVNDISFGVDKGAFLTLLGPSGCGKTTTLMCIAGLHHPDGGDIWLGDTCVTSVSKGIFCPPKRRGIGMVFQSYAIWPHMTVAQNIAYPLEVQRVPRAERQERVHEALRRAQIVDFTRRPATHLSGGQQQRVAIARAIVFNPHLLLFDEPLSNLDAKLREEMRVELKRLQETLGRLNTRPHVIPIAVLMLSGSASCPYPAAFPVQPARFLRNLTLFSCSYFSVVRFRSKRLLEQKRPSRCKPNVWLRGLKKRKTFLSHSSEGGTS